VKKKEASKSLINDLKALQNRDTIKKLEAQGFTHIRFRQVKDQAKEAKKLLKTIWATSSFEALQTNLRNIYETAEAQSSQEDALSKVWEKIEFIKRYHKNIVKEAVQWVAEKYGRKIKNKSTEIDIQNLKSKIQIIEEQTDEVIKRNSIILSGLDRVSRLRIEVTLFLREENRKIRIRPLELYKLDDRMKARGREYLRLKLGGGLKVETMIKEVFRKPKKKQMNILDEYQESDYR
jgi:hypothetical protein